MFVLGVSEICSDFSSLRLSLFRILVQIYISSSELSAVGMPVPVQSVSVILEIPGCFILVLFRHLCCFLKYLSQTFQSIREQSLPLTGKEFWSEWPFFGLDCPFFRDSELHYLILQCFLCLLTSSAAGECSGINFKTSCSEEVADFNLKRWQWQILFKRTSVFLWSPSVYSYFQVKMQNKG